MQITSPTRNGHAEPPIESRKSYQFVNPYYAMRAIPLETKTRWAAPRICQLTFGIWSVHNAEYDSANRKGKQDLNRRRIHVCIREQLYSCSGV